MSNILSENLKVERKKKGWTQQQVAKKIFISRPLYNFFEKGKRQPSLDTLQRICTLFGTDITTITTRSLVNV